MAPPSQTLEPPGFPARFRALIGLLWVISRFLGLDGSQFIRAGGWAEEWTSEALRKRCPGFELIDDFPLAAGNIDHVLIGPGGVYAVETKWKSRWKGHQIPLTRPTLSTYLRQATTQAGSLQQILASLELNTRVRAALVLWGPGVPTDEACIQFGRVPVYVGDRAKEWPGRPLNRERLNDNQVDEIRRCLLAHVERHSPDSKASAGKKAVQVARALFAARTPNAPGT